MQFNAGANNIAATKPILENSGVQIYDFNNHPFDTVPNIVGGNAEDCVSTLGSVIGFAFVCGIVGKSPHTECYEGPTKTVRRVYNFTNQTQLLLAALINSLPR
jgi:hypothetical protein